MLTRRTFAAGLAGAAATLHAAAPAPAPDARKRGFNGPFVLALIAPSQSVDEVRSRWRPLGERIAQKLGTELEMRVSHDYGEIQRALVEGRAHVAWLSNSGALEVVEAGAGEVFATMHVKGPDGKPASGYHSQVVVRDDSPMATLEALLAKAGTLTLRMADAKSTSGYIIPNYYVFSKRGRTPQSTFRSVVVGSHTENIAAVLAGQADACATNDEEIKKLAQRDAAAARRLKVLWSSPEIRQSPLVWSATLPAPVRAAIKEVVLGFGRTPTEQAALMASLT